MDADERTTGTRDEHYNLISVLYRALHGAETIEAYVLDAEAVGDERLAGFFREAQATQRELAERAKELLGIGEGLAPETAGGVAPDTAPLESRPRSDTEPVDVRGRMAPEVGFSPESEVTLDSMPGVIPPPSTGLQREPDVSAGEFGATTEETSQTTAILRTSSTTPLPDEDLVAEMEGVAPEDERREASTEGATRETPPIGQEGSDRQRGR